MHVINFSSLHLSVSALALSLYLPIVVANCEPMPEATQEQACASSDIITAEYLRYRADGPTIEFFKPPLAIYRVKKVIKGSLHANEEIEVPYDVHMNGSCIAPPGWKFNSRDMPKKGTVWLVYLIRSTDNSRLYNAYRSEKFLNVATKENVIEAEKCDNPEH